ncbi:Hypothetical protein B591_11691 [Streptomyces sp. GBA 94-10 4N24]|nr:Hypothetical protein B591_11691 [Streptomyces sp. GBA 94-10 4N24]ESQ06420.1 Hypothetical protein B590_11780 [Streptomyces sp. PVA_94-07]UZN59325.1 Hypothetical protein B591N_11691 [Streptomyces sp. GBA 94-10 4N24]
MPPSTALAAARSPRFPAAWERDRMTRPEPWFLWTMYRSGWSRKEGRERVPAVEISREGSDRALGHACLSAYHPDVHGDRDAWRGALRGSPAPAVRRYAHERLVPSAAAGPGSRTTHRHRARTITRWRWPVRGARAPAAPPGWLTYPGRSGWAGVTDRKVRRHGRGERTRDRGSLRRRLPRPGERAPAGAGAGGAVVRAGRGDGPVRPDRGAARGRPGGAGLGGRRRAPLVPRYDRP